ncbi:MAG: polysaccharide deacetylase family protein [Candidatus Omnitrophica bacterium]|nr:polysaccharide deacetylase family protein [Candidatus Omnitrophota bacterium]
MDSTRMTYFTKKIIRKVRQCVGQYDSPKGLMILMYHRVNPDLPDHNLVTRPEMFARQMRFLTTKKHVYDFVSLKDFEQQPAQFIDKPGPKTKIIITFDDGYRDNFLYAYPVLRRWSIPATIFLTTHLINTEKKFKRYEAVSGRDMLNQKEIQQMAATRITFGAHTCKHVHLPRLPVEQQRAEVLDSLHALETLVPPGGRVKTFCYPYGEYSTDTIRVVRQAGCPCALTVQVGVNQSDTPPLELKRVEISGMDDLKSFEFKVLEKFINTKSIK